MGRHTTPGTGKPTPDRGFWVRLAAVLVVVVGIGGTYLLARGEPETARTQTGGQRAAATTYAPPPTSPSPPAATSPTSSASATSPSPTRTKRPPTLRFVVHERASYITVRVPGGRTLVSRLFREGARRSFDQRVLQVVNGRPDAVHFWVNGRKREPGPPAQPERFTVRRR